MTKYRTILSFLILLTTFTRISAKEICGEYRYVGDENLSLKEQKAKALSGAIENALEKEYGTSWKGETTTGISVRDGKTSLNATGRATVTVMGEWVQTTSDKYEVINENGLTVIKCSVCGISRDLVENDKIDIETYTLRATQQVDAYLNGLLRTPNKDMKGTDFYEGNLIYLYFKSPEDGYVSVYLEAEDDYVYRILPYAEETQTSTHVTANKEYIFFCKNCDEKNKKVKELELTADGDIEYNKIHILFAPNKIDAPFIQIEEGQLPRIKMENFHKWRSKAMMGNKKCQHREIGITIRKK